VKAHYGGIKIIFPLNYFLKVQYLNFNHVIIMKDFHNIFAYYDKSKPKKSNVKKTKLFYFIWCDVRIYSCKKNICHNVLKTTNIFNKWLKSFLIFMKIVVSIKHVILYYWNKFVNCVKILIIIISQMGFFKVMTISMW
jgi:hypothetical protein